MQCIRAYSVRQAKPDFSNDLKSNHHDNWVSIM